MGSKNMRAQLSLLFTDEELYDNFIVPSKNSRLLHSIILKCLTAYYYNVDIRKQIEGIEVHNSEMENNNTPTRQESINNIREILLMQGYLAQELQNSMEDGIDEVSDILETVNQKGVDIGAMQESRNAYNGKTVEIKALEDKSMSKDVKTTAVPNELADTLKEMSEFMSMVKQSGMMSQLQSTVETNNVSTEPVEDTDIEETVVEEPKKPTVKRGKKVEKKEELVETTEIDNGANSTDLAEEFKETPAEVVAPPPALPKELVIGEASDALSELLDSL